MLTSGTHYAGGGNQTEEALRASEENYRLLVQQIPAVVFRGYPDWSVDFFDEKIETLTGYTKQEFDSRRLKWVDLIPSEDVPQAQQILLEAHKAKQSYVREHRIRRKDGEIRWVQSRGQIFSDDNGKIDHIDGVLFDITGRKEAEEALRASEERFRQLFDASNDAIFVHPPVTTEEPARFNEVNEVACNMLGYTREEMLQLSVGDIGDPEKAADFPAVRERLRSEKHVLFETTLITKDGSKVPVEISSRLFDLGGQPMVLSVVRDIRERLEAQEALRESESRFSAFMRHLPGVAFMRDREGRMLFANETWERVLRKKPNEGLGKTPLDVFPPEAAARFQEYHRQVIERGKPMQTVDVILHDDGPHTWLTHRFPIFDKNGVATIVGSIGIDITERQQVLEALEVERQRLFSLLDGLPALVHLVAPDYTIRFANRIFRETFGEPAGKSCYEVVNKSSTPCPDCEAFKVFRTKKPQTCEWGVGGRTYQLYEYPFNDVDGSPLVLVMGTDITERKRAEEKLQESKEHLHYLASQLFSAQERERQRISRDLHDDLGQSLLVFKLQLREIEREMPANLGKLKQRLAKQVALIDDIVNNVRRFSRDLRPSILDDLGLIIAIERLLEEFGALHDIEVSLDLDDVGDLLSPQAQIIIYRIFQECLTNIGKYAQASRIVVSIKKVNGEVSFSVEDNGKGFDLEQVRAQGVAKRGLGLTAMEERVRMLGGALEIHSQKGVGTRVSFKAGVSALSSSLNDN